MALAKYGVWIDSFNLEGCDIDTYDDDDTTLNLKEWKYFFVLKSSSFSQ